MPSLTRRRFLVVLATSGVSGCVAAGRDFLAAHEEAPAPKAGVVFVVGGVGGMDLIGRSCEWTLPQCGVPHEVRDFVWTHGWGRILKDLQDAEYLTKKADELAAEVRRVKEADPDRPVYLVGKSGGAGLVLLAAERLPPQTLERIVLLSAAVAPTYDLRPAFRATKHEIVAYHSPRDGFILGWGTGQFGTIDRLHGPSAGLNGFRIPDNLSEDERTDYDRLIQVAWRPEMILEGNAGGHCGTSLPAFVSTEVAPWLKP
jgi:pimeloyl-ACP methyl ester carboxylesterase